jgi:hypothetical protein
MVVPGAWATRISKSQILLAHQKYWLPIANRYLMNSSSKSFGVYFVVSFSKISSCPGPALCFEEV